MFQEFKKVFQEEFKDTPKVLLWGLLLLVLWAGFNFTVAALRGFSSSSTVVKNFDPQDLRFFVYQPDQVTQPLCFAVAGYQRSGEWVAASSMMMSAVDCNHPAVAAALSKDSASP